MEKKSPLELRASSTTFDNSSPTSNVEVKKEMRCLYFDVRSSTFSVRRSHFFSMMPVYPKANNSSHTPLDAPLKHRHTSPPSPRKLGAGDNLRQLPVALPDPSAT
jgi:hypothetical protein